jgi:hypothetical protein
MTENHPITPPPELVQQWQDEALKGYRTHDIYKQDIATQAARWGLTRSWMLAVSGYKILI